MRISFGAGGWTVSDSVPIFAGGGCANPPGDANLVTCGGTLGLALVTVTGGNGNDDIVIDPSVPAPRT